MKGDNGGTSGTNLGYCVRGLTRGGRLPFFPDLIVLGVSFEHIDRFSFFKVRERRGGGLSKNGDGADFMKTPPADLKLIRRHVRRI